jgi:hypothetical protein
MDKFVDQIFPKHLQVPDIELFLCNWKQRYESPRVFAIDSHFSGSGGTFRTFSLGQNDLHIPMVEQKD